MKVKTLSVLAGLGGSLLLGSAANAAFTGLVAETKDASDTTGWNNPALDLFVCNVYMQFSDPMDVGYAVAGTPNTPMSITANGASTFYQNAFGGDTAPSAALVAAFPSLAFDTFLTWNHKLDDGDPATPGFSPGFPGFVGNFLGGTNLGWFVTPNSPLAVPDASGRVLIAQLTIDVATEPGATGISGSMLVQWDDPNGNTTQQSASFDHPIPAPGALALLGMAGLMGTRRRRR